MTEEMTSNDKEMGKKRLNSRQKSFRNYFVRFSLMSILRSSEVTKVRFSEIAIFSEMCNYLRNYYRQEAAKNKQVIAFAFDLFFR